MVFGIGGSATRDVADRSPLEARAQVFDLRDLETHSRDSRAFGRSVASGRSLGEEFAELNAAINGDRPVLLRGSATHLDSFARAIDRRIFPEPSFDVEWTMPEADFPWENDVTRELFELNFALEVRAVTQGLDGAPLAVAFSPKELDGVGDGSQLWGVELRRIDERTELAMARYQFRFVRPDTSVLTGVIEIDAASFALAPEYNDAPLRIEIGYGATALNGEETLEDLGQKSIADAVGSRMHSQLVPLPKYLIRFEPKCTVVPDARIK